MWRSVQRHHFADGVPNRDILGSWLFALRLSRLRAVARQLSDLLPGIGERSGPDQLGDSSLLLCELIPIVFDALAPLAEFGPAANVLVGDPQLRLLSGFFDPADYLFDQRRGSLCIGGGALLNFGLRTHVRPLEGGLRGLQSVSLQGLFVHGSAPEELARVPLRVRVIRVRLLVI